MSNPGFRRRPRPRTVFCALLALAVGGAAALQAASTGFWVVATQADFLKGDTDAVSIDTDGRVTIAPALQLLGDVGTPAVWRIAAARGQVWAATGHDGKLWSFPAQGAPKVLFDAAGARSAGHRAPGRRGSVLVGSAPDGKVYRVARGRHVDDVLRPRGQVHLGDRGGPGRHHLRRHRRQGEGLQGAGRRRRRHAVLRHRHRARQRAGLRRRRQAAGRHVDAGPRRPPRRRRQAVRAPRSRLPGSAQPARRRRRHLRHGRRRPRPARRRRRRPAPPPTPAPRSRCRPR